MIGNEISIKLLAILLLKILFSSNLILIGLQQVVVKDILLSITS